MAKRTALLPASDDEVRAQLHATLAKLVEPSTAKQVVSKLAKPFKRDVGEITNMLEEAVVRGVAHRYPKGKQVRYHADPADVVLAGAIESALGDRPKTWTDLKKVGTLKKAATWVVSKELDRVRDVLLKNGRLPRWPKVGPIKSERYAKRAASLEDPADYACHFVDKFRQDLKALAKALAKSGTTAEQLDEAARDLLGWKTDRSAWG